MQKETQYILVADYVPLANKGEEAIIRGIEDMLGDERPIRIGLFGDVEEINHYDNITIFPFKWIYQMSGEAGNRWVYLLRNLFIVLQMVVGYYPRAINMLSRKKHYRPLGEFFERSEYVIVGHDGFFRTESCGIIHLAKKAGKRVGILGASAGISRIGRLYKGWLYRRALDECDFCIFRERHSQENMQQVSSTPAKLVLAPDPAFAMKHAGADSALEVLESYDKFRNARKDRRPIVVATVLEKGRVYSCFMPKLKSNARRKVHADYLSGIFDSLIKERNAFVVFLPHSIEGDASDVVAAKHVAEAMESGCEDYLIIDKNLPARVLKSIIKESDFLIGERTHSLIGSISVATAFMALTNCQDTRTRGIVGDMCKCEYQIVDMNILDSIAVCRKALELFDQRTSIEDALQQRQTELSNRLDEICRIIKGQKY